MGMPDPSFVAAVPSPFASKSLLPSSMGLFRGSLLKTRR